MKTLKYIFVITSFLTAFNVHASEPLPQGCSILFTNYTEQYFNFKTAERDYSSVVNANKSTKSSSGSWNFPKDETSDFTKANNALTILKSTIQKLKDGGCYPDDYRNPILDTKIRDPKQQ